MITHNYIIRNDKGNYIFNDDVAIRKETERAAKELNHNSVIPCKLLCKYTPDIHQKLLNIIKYFICNYMSYDYCGKGYQLSFSGYPNDECESYLTNITINTNEYFIYGIKIGDNINKLNDCLLSAGYSRVSRKEFESKYVYKRGLIIIKCDEKEGKVNSFNIQVKTFYLGNRIY